MFRVVPILIGLLFVSLIGFGIFVMADSIGTSDQYGIGIIVDKDFVPEHTETSMSYDSFCECMQTSTTYYDDKSSVRVNMIGTLGWIVVSQSSYNNLPRDEKAYITYYVGRFSDTIYFKDVELLE